MKNPLSLLSLLVGILFIPGLARAELRLSLLFSDGAVLQRDEPVRVWGWAEAGEELEVELGDLEVETTADASGAWKVEFPPQPAGGPFELEVEGREEELEVEDLYFGDVWVCSGQSNMEWNLARSYRLDSTLALAEHYPLVRHFKVPRSWAEEPQAALAGGEWEVFSAETGADFTAVGLFFALEVHRVTGVPIGLLNTSWGGSRIEPWMRADVLGIAGNSLDAMLEERRERAEKTRAELAKKIGEVGADDRGMDGDFPQWAFVGLDDADWEAIRVPSLWEGEGYEGLDGVGWYRTTFELGAADISKDVVLRLGMIDDTDQVWLNGMPVGGLEQSYNVPRVYPVQPAALKFGKNFLTVRVEDTGGGGGIYGDPGSVGIVVDGEFRPFPGPWKFKVGAVYPSEVSQPNMNHVPTVLYNAMIAPLQRFPIKGAIWYQGESNASFEDAYLYRVLFKDMISSWREQWGQGDFPFFWVQLANFENGSDTPGMSPWAVLRESQSAALELPMTGQAVIIDIGAPHDIHPKNKHDVGHRLALQARRWVYGETELVHSGPVYQSMQVEGPQAVLAFDHVAGGLEASSGGTRVAGFEIAGADGAFVPAEAVIQGDQVVVSSPAVSAPAAVRYAWAANPEAANLVNSEGLPASPFRTSE